MVSGFFLPIHEGTNDEQHDLLLKGTGPTWQERILHQEIIAGDSRDGHEARRGEAGRVGREVSELDTCLARLVHYPGAVGSPRGSPGLCPCGSPCLVVRQGEPDSSN